jgi:hypothetical protein
MFYLILYVEILFGKWKKIWKPGYKSYLQTVFKDLVFKDLVLNTLSPDKSFLDDRSKSN